MKIKKIEEIIVWQKTQELAVDIYAIFLKIRDYCFKDQILRTVVSISNNKADGFERNSDADFSRFLNIAKGSFSEVKSMIFLSVKLKYVNNEEVESLIFRCSEITMIINGLIKSLNILKNEKRLTTNYFSVKIIYN